MVNAISSVDTLNVGERIHSLQVSTPKSKINDIGNQIAGLGLTGTSQVLTDNEHVGKNKVLGQDDYVNALPKVKEGIGKQGLYLNLGQTPPMEVEKASHLNTVRATTNNSYVPDSQIADSVDGKLEVEADHTLRRSMGAKVGGVLSDSNDDQISLSENLLLSGEISQTNKSSSDLDQIATGTKLKTLVVNVKDDNDEKITKLITVDNRGQIVSEETKRKAKSDSKETSMKEEKRNIDSLITDFQAKREAVQSAMSQLKTSVASGNTSEVHGQSAEVKKAIDTLRGDATSLYNKIALYEGQVFDVVHVNNQSQSGVEIAKNSKTLDQSISISQDDQTDVDSQITVTTKNTRDVVADAASNYMVDVDPLFNQPSKPNTGALPNDLQESLANHDSNTNSQINTADSQQNSKNATKSENASNTTAYVENAALTNQAAASASLNAGTGALNLADVNNDAHRSHVGMHDNSTMDLDSAVEESNQSETDNNSSSNSDRHDNNQTYQQQDMDYGYNSRAVGAYGGGKKTKNSYDENSRAKQRQANIRRYEQSNTNADIDAMEDHLNRLSLESSKVQNEESIISQAPDSMQDQMRNDAVARRERRLSFM